VDWFTGAGGAPLNLLALADNLYVHELVPQAAVPFNLGALSFPYRAAGGWAVTSKALTNGVSDTIAVTLGLPTATANLPVSWSRSAFETHLPAMGPPGMTTTDASAHTLSIGASAHPLTIPAPLAAGTPRLLTMSFPIGGGDLVADAPLVYGQFLASPLWTEWREAEFTAHVSYAVGAAAPLVEHAVVGRREQLPGTTPIAPVLGPVQAPVIGAVSAFTTPPPAVGFTPTFSWSAPTTGTPTRYTLTIYRLQDQAGTTISTRVGSWTTGGLQVTLPAGVLVPEGSYYARIVATATTGDSFATDPFRTSSPLSSYATTLTAPFTP
jgi:hypothetical protein